MYWPSENNVHLSLVFQILVPIISLISFVPIPVLYQSRRSKSRFDPDDGDWLVLEAIMADRMEALNAYLASQGKPTFIYFGPNANCTLDLCPPQWSVYGYRPSLGVNLAFLIVFLLALIVHVAMGIRWRAWYFMACMICGCLDEILGYAARVWMFYDLWNFNAFMLQVGKQNTESSRPYSKQSLIISQVCITTAPVFYCASIYVVLAKTFVLGLAPPVLLLYLFQQPLTLSPCPNSISTCGPALSRFRPSLIYWVFISCDLVSLILQGIGGALSAVSSGLSQKGVNIALAGLALQVFTLVLFCAVYLDFVWRYYNSGLAKRHGTQREGRSWTFGNRLRVFYACEVLAIVMILARCAFRVDELSDGYGGPLVKREGLFIGLEGV